MLPDNALGSLLGWMVSCARWCVSSAGNDDAFLRVIFALDASIASVDSFTHGFMESMRDDFRRLVAKYKDPEWLASVEKSIKGDSAESLSKKGLLGTAIDKAFALEQRIPLLFRRNARIWKTAMCVCAAAALCCMVIPYKGRILVLLALPVPLLAIRCLQEERQFKKEAEKACQEIDRLHESIKNSEGQKPLDKDVAYLRDELPKVAEALAAIAANGILPQTSPAGRSRARKSQKKGSGTSTRRRPSARPDNE